MIGVDEPWIIRPHSLSVPSSVAPRVPPRPPGLQETGYLDRYDATTVSYDVFRCGSRVLAIGPPAGSLDSFVRRLRVGGAGAHLDEGLDRLGRFWFPRGRDAALLEVPGGENVVIGEDLAGAFRGRFAVATLSKDNDLQWVSDWARWYVDHHGADAFVVYDNGSTRYALEELWHALAAVTGVAVAAVVDWPFRYGPIGVHPHHLFDSNYAQHGSLEHARWRLLREAAGYLSVDIDELVLPADDDTVFGVTTGSGCGRVSIPGTWTYPAPDVAAARPPRHANSTWIKVRPPDAASPPKWCIVPSRMPRRAQLMVHTLRGAHLDRPPTLRFAHLLDISTDWYGGRSSFHVVPGRYAIDEALAAAHESDAHGRGATSSTTSRAPLLGRHPHHWAAGLARRVVYRLRARRPR